MTVVASIVPVRAIPPPPKRHRWNHSTCKVCGITRDGHGPRLRDYSYYRDGKWIGDYAPSCVASPTDSADAQQVKP